jgi:hypothetical protein
VVIRILLNVAVLLGVLFTGAGRVHAVLGVADDVPGQDVVVPIICEGHHNLSGGVPVFGSLNTVWAIANHTPSADELCFSGVCTPHDGGVGVVHATVTIFDRKSVHRLDTGECWSGNDVVSDDCQHLISSMSPDDVDSMEVTIGGITYFAGYVLYKQDAACEGGLQNRFTAWVYLNDIAKGFATGFNGISLENGAGPHMEETCNISSCSGSVAAVRASTLFPRFFILNADPDSFNWWIFLLGSNHSGRAISCILCDEEEHCFSGGVSVPFELNIVNVGGILPGGLFPGSALPKAGFATCSYGGSGSIFGWSYQRAVPVSCPVKLSVVHPIHRE